MGPHPPGWYATGGGQGPRYPRPRGHRRARVAVLAGVAVLLLGGVAAGIGVYLQQKDAAAAEVGDCLRYRAPEAPGRSAPAVSAAPQQTPPADTAAPSAEAETADCGEDQALYKVAIRHEDRDADCPTEDYDEYVPDGRDASEEVKLCLVPNAEEGACYEFTADSEGRVPCSLAPNQERLRVLRIFDGVEDEARCADVPENVRALVYPEPPLTICTAPLTGEPES